jgi:carbon storage regulator
MLVLSRKEGERIIIKENIIITVINCRGKKVRLGIDAPADVEILREELESHPGESPISCHRKSSVR